MLLQANHNYQERGMNTVIYTSSVDDRYGKREIVSRIGLRAKSNIFSETTNIYEEVVNLNKNKRVDCVLIDEAQFLNKNQVEQLGKIVDILDTPVLTFGIRTDFKGNLFEGSEYLLAWADNLKEIRVKENQNVDTIFLSSLFKKNKNYMGLNKFKLLTRLTRKKTVALGGVSKKNLKNLKLLNTLDFAGISYFE